MASPTDAQPAGEDEPNRRCPDSARTGRSPQNGHRESAHNRRPPSSRERMPSAHAVRSHASTVRRTGRSPDGAPMRRGRSAGACQRASHADRGSAAQVDAAPRRRPSRRAAGWPPALLRGALRTQASASHTPGGISTSPRPVRGGAGGSGRGSRPSAALDLPREQMPFRPRAMWPRRRRRRRSCRCRSRSARGDRRRLRTRRMRRRRGTRSAARGSPRGS
jgi:hypothetical protein